MAFAERMNQSIRGRDLGFEFLSSAKHGSQRPGRMLVGPETMREYYSTAETTATNLPAYGYSVLTPSSVGSSQIFTLDPPIPGVRKTVVFNTTVDNIYLRASTASTVTFLTASQGTTKCYALSTGLNSVALNLIGMTTAVWAVVGAISSAHINFTTST